MENSIKTNNKAIHVKNLSISLQGNKILSNISFTLKHNESVAIIGSSGSGKTTLLKSIAGFIKNFDSGEIFLNNKLIQSNEIFTKPINRDCALLFQGLSLWPHLTVKEHLDFVINKKIQEYNKHKLLDIFNLKKHLNKKPFQLSGGEKQRLALARIFASKIKIILLDEPFSSLDLVTKSKMIKLLKKIRNEFNFSLIHITHDINEAHHIANNIILLNNGKISWSGHTNDFFKSNSYEIKDLQKAYKWINKL